MRLAILSDLHIAPPGSNRCTTPPDALLALITQLKAEHDEVVALGDLYDLSRPSRPMGWAAQHEAIQRAWPELVAALSACSPVFGNHDLWLGNVGVPEERAWTTRAGLVLARHGHQWDGGLKRVPGLAGAANFVAGWGQRAGLSGVDRAFHLAQSSAERALGAASGWGAAQDRTRAGALELLDRGEAEVLIVGHSHRLGLVARGGRLLIETGAHCHGHQDWATLDTDAGEAVIWRDGEATARALYGDGGWVVA